MFIPETVHDEDAGDHRRAYRGVRDHNYWADGSTSTRIPQLHYTQELYIKPGIVICCFLARDNYVQIQQPFPNSLPQSDCRDPESQ